MRPHHPRVRGIKKFVEPVMRFLAHLHRPRAGFQQLPQALHDVTHLAFRVINRAAAMREVGARSVQQEQVGKRRHRDPQISARIVVAPQRADGLAAPARDFHRRQHASRVEPGREHQHIGGHVLSGLRHHAIRDDAFDAIGDEIDIVTGQHLVPMIVTQHPFAVRWIRRHDFLHQCLVAVHLIADIGDDRIAKLLIGFVQ